MDRELEKDIQSTVLDLYALRDLMDFIVKDTSEEKIDKDALCVFVHSIDVSITQLKKHID